MVASAIVRPSTKHAKDGQYMRMPHACTPSNQCCVPNIPGCSQVTKWDRSGWQTLMDACVASNFTQLCCLHVAHVCNTFTETKEKHVCRSSPCCHLGGTREPDYRRVRENSSESPGRPLPLGAQDSPAGHSQHTAPAPLLAGGPAASQHSCRWHCCQWAACSAAI